MPIYSRRTLRQRLGQEWLHDSVIGTTSGQCDIGTALTALDSAQQDPTASGEQLFQKHYLRMLGSAGVIADARVASFNTGSGAFVSAVLAATTVYSGMPYEVAALISPADKDRALDTVIRDVRIRQRLPIWAIDQGRIYSLGDEVRDVADVYYQSDPTGSLDKGESPIPWFRFDQTGSGNQLRIAGSLVPSQQLIVDALVTVSLGANDLATVNVPSDSWVLAGAAARCYWMMEQQAPGKEAAAYRQRRAEAANQYTRLSARFQPFVTRRTMLDEPY